MKNLLEETLQVLAKHGLAMEDVVWTGIPEIGYLTPCGFEDEASKVRYVPGALERTIPDGLVVVGGDWWLSRYPGIGLECWVFNKMPQKPTKLLDYDGELTEAVLRVSTSSENND